MKYLSDYMEAKQTQLFKETGTFFAFSNKQYEEQADESKTYVYMGAGMYTLKKYATDQIEKHYQIYKNAMQQDLKENGIKGVIQRELENYEVYYTNDLEPAMEALKDYPEITQKDIIKVYQRKWDEEK
jgi:hypothetical protein|tara:strand:+ start:70 stop:453 length:384 start_codon:yes stop_codon:yes gene_type:complete